MAPITLTIATSSKYNFSQPVIDANITSQATADAANLKAINGSLVVLNQIGNAIANSASSAAQSAAMQQLDVLVADPNNGLPTQITVGNAQQRVAGISQILSTLTNATLQSWEGLDNSTGEYNVSWNGALPPNGTDAGWCHYTDQTTLAAWENVWKK
jgi:hypothetical protein